MVDTQRTITAQDIQILAIRFNQALVDAAPAVAPTVAAVLRPWQELGERLQRQYEIETIVARLVEAERQLERHQHPLHPSNQPEQGEFWPSLK